MSRKPQKSKCKAPHHKEFHSRVYKNAKKSSGNSCLIVLIIAFGVISGTVTYGATVLW